MMGRSGMPLFEAMTTEASPCSASITGSGRGAAGSVCSANPGEEIAFADVDRRRDRSALEFEDVLVDCCQTMVEAISDPK